MDPVCPAFSPNRRTRTAAIAWAFFLGWIGAHKFYLGSPGWGILFALSFWTLLPWFYAWVEALGLVLMSDDYFDRLYN